MYYSIDRLPKVGLPFGQVFETSDGHLMRQTTKTDQTIGKWLMHIALCGGKTQAEVSVINGQVVPNPMWVPNSVFSDEAGNYFIRTLEDQETANKAKAAQAGCGYIINREYSTGEMEAVKDGLSMPLPELLYNEFGVPYHLVNFRIYGQVCKILFGYVEAEKVEPVYFITDEVGTPVNSVLNGINEHAAVLKEGEVLVQNAYHGERYKQKRSKLESNYEPAEMQGGFRLWRPKKVTQQWTITEENIYGPLWGSFEFLAKAAINITNDNDVYGCNYDVFAGNDAALGSHRKLRRFLPKNPVSRETALEILKRSRQDGMFALQFVLNNLQAEFVEVPVGVCNF